MTVNQRNIFGPNVPETPQNSAIYDGDMAPERQPTSGALDTPISAGHGEAAAFRAAQARSSGEKPGGSAGFGLGGSTDTDFSTSRGDGGPGDLDGDMPSQGGPGGGKGIAGTDPMVSGGYSSQEQSDDTGSDTSGYGKAIG